MGIKVQVPLDEWDKDKDQDFFEDWETIFNDNYGAQKTLYNSVSYWGYGGWLDIDILLKDGRVLSYEYGFDSCCDRLDGCAYQDNEESCTEIEEDITTHATFFDTLDQYIAWVETLPDQPGGPTGTEENERRSALKESGAAEEI